MIMFALKKGQDGLLGNSVTYWKSRKARRALKMNKKVFINFWMKIKLEIRDLPWWMKQTCVPSGPLTPGCWWKPPPDPSMSSFEHHQTLNNNWQTYIFLTILIQSSNSQIPHDSPAQEVRVAQVAPWVREDQGDLQVQPLLEILVIQDFLALPVGMNGNTTVVGIKASSLFLH